MVAFATSFELFDFPIWWLGYKKIYKRSNLCFIHPSAINLTQKGQCNCHPQQRRNNGHSFRDILVSLFTLSLYMRWGTVYVHIYIARFILIRNYFNWLNGYLISVKLLELICNKIPNQIQYVYEHFVWFDSYL